MFARMSTDQLYQAANYFAAAEAIRRTGFEVKLREEERRFRLEVNGRIARVFSRRAADKRPMRMGTQQDASDAHAVVFVDMSSESPKFFVVPANLARSEIEEWEGRWDLFGDSQI